LAVAVTPDGRYVVSASGDHTLRVWDLETGLELRTLAGHTSWVVSVTADGRYAVSASDDDTLRVWDIETGKSLSTYHGDSVFAACALGSTGSAVVAGEYLGRVHILHLENVACGPPVVTPWRLPLPVRPWWQFWRRSVSIAFGCPFCRTWWEIRESALCTELSCPNCGEMIKLNPFTIDADWQPVALAWRGENSLQ
jgi:WD40 repeat protein